MSVGWRRAFSKFVGFLAVFFLTAAVTGSAGAISLNPITAIKGAVEAALEDRSADDIGVDLKLKAVIVAEVVEKMTDDVISIGVDVYEQDVMLTGAVDNALIRARAGQLVAAIEGIKKLHNEILIIKPLDKDKGAVENFVDDTVIETKINALLLDATGVNVTNFRYRSINGNVFLFGRAFSAKEKQKATAVARDVENVKSVKNLAKVRAKK